MSHHKTFFVILLMFTVSAKSPVEDFGS